jgi:hypothetical protein
MPTPAAHIDGTGQAARTRAGMPARVWIRPGAWLAAVAMSVLCEMAGSVSLWSSKTAHQAGQLMTWAARHRNRLRTLPVPRPREPGRVSPAPGEEGSRS